MNYYIANSSDYLEHHGILGMKWGVRRYQNKDGSLTEAGMKRYGSVQNAHEKMRKKEKRRGFAVAGSTIAIAAINTFFDKFGKTKIKYDNYGNLVVSNNSKASKAIALGVASIPAFLSVYGEIEYNKFLKYYAEELGVDTKDINKIRLRGSL